MAAIQQNRVCTNVRSEEYNNPRSVSGDKAIAEEVVRNIIDDLGGNAQLRSLFNKISGPLTAEKGIMVLALLKELPTLTVVPNEVNKHPHSGLTMITWKRYIDITNHQTTTFLTATQIAALRSQNTRCITICTIATVAFEALCRHVQKLINQSR